MSPPADISLDSAHAVFYRCRHVRQKTRESTRQTSTNLENPPKIDLKSTKIAPRDPPRALFSLPGTLPGRFFRHFFAGLRPTSRISREFLHFLVSGGLAGPLFRASGGSRERFRSILGAPGSLPDRFWVPRGASRDPRTPPDPLFGIPFLPGSCQHTLPAGKLPEFAVHLRCSPSGFLREGTAISRQGIKFAVPLQGTRRGSE